MCGIVGYIGPKNSVDVIMAGLLRLEYRGYDSAGICIKSDEKLKIFKAVGKLENLKKILEEKRPSSQIGIGHTRWATHGSVVENNAHPHGDDNVAIVHNGIIENAKELKKGLVADGYKFFSDTDSEVFYNLIKSYSSKGLGLKDAVSEAFKILKGNSAFVVMDKKGLEIVTVKRSAPLVLGDNQEILEAFVSSDPYALVGHAERLYFPEDDVVCVLRSESIKFKFYELDGKESKRFKVKVQTMKQDECEKGTFEHYMQKEIFEQPTLIRNFIKYYLSDEGLKTLEEISRLNPKKIHISACGTAWHAGLVIRDYIERNNRIPTHVELASEFRYRDPIFKEGDLGLFISQSGETADTLAAQELTFKGGLKTISIVNVEGSTLYRNCNYNLLIKAGVEVGVASTKAFTLQVLTGYLFSEALKGNFNKGLVASKMESLATQIDLLLSRDNEIKEIARTLYNKKGFLFTGRGIYHPIALEGALKLKEIAYVHAEGYAAGELKHGPIALIDEEIVNIALVGPELYHKTVSNLQEVMARNGIILAVGPKEVREDLGPNDHLIELDITEGEEFNPLYINVVNQLLSYEIAKLKGTDIDRPRNLAKSVTVE